MILRHCGMRNPSYRVVGFLDDDLRRYRVRVEGVPVIGDLAEAAPLAAKHKVEQVLVVQDKLTGLQLRGLMDQAQQCGLTVRVIPSYKQLINGSMTARAEARFDRRPASARSGAVEFWGNPRLDRRPRNHGYR